ncbi:sigma 54-interacting transcriptional regulator [Sporomusa acidovorans]|uniref:Anaerobic nitric oxide reductase transcription regulator NorR n=1 Tax=Sporomusa acidovorans (strain ATCC 49682 / DSM 3132 / Mol) TaxID=1123286 RepID=A0ABZ3IXF3_SPOA4|nr:sigma 54-interacting transcriptional regulator [Sporomusa acidovorans]OZC22367.1 limonene hydroxylase [Sporomusa acidovorans DSM 3132]SDE46958.1 Transcriptional regulator containing PAS, AAA-type ATPase, and DNA-binding Fis domains [Sporomusa acidovorans]
MLTNKIALIAPNKNFTLRALDLFGEWGEKIHVAVATKEDVVTIGQQLSERGADALICYATFNETIKTTVNIPTVSLRPSLLDLLQCLQAVKNWLINNGKTVSSQPVVGLIGDAIGTDAAAVAAILGIETKNLSGEQREDLSEIAAVVKEVTIIDDNQPCEPVSTFHTVPCFQVTVGRETVFKALQQARELVMAGRVERVKLEQFKAIMEFTGEGIIAVDSRRRISYINHTAERLLNKSREQIVGKLAAAVLPDINLDDTLRYGQTRVAPLTSGDQSFTCRIVPMLIGGQTVGAVLAINEVPFSVRDKDKANKALDESGYKAVYHFEDFITANPFMQETLEAAKSYACVDSTILIHGDTGTGKEIIAQSIHNYSPRCQGPFVAVNCAALPESLLESELFGYESGAFTGARKNGKKGLFEQADKGTIFLDEIGEISLSMQARLLRVLQQREIMRIGGDKVIPVDVGIIAATHRNLPELIEKGAFRRDLYHRLSILQLRLLPLSARTEDIPPLVETIGRKYAAKLLKKTLQFSAGAMNILTRYRWPGNVRELEGVVERLMILKKDTLVTAEDVNKVLDISRQCLNDDVRTVPKGTMEEIEYAIIMQVLKETGSHELTAKTLGISTTTIWRKIKSFQNERQHFNLQ